MSYKQEVMMVLQEGQVIYVLKKNDDGWWEGVMVRIENRNVVIKVYN